MCGLARGRGARAEAHGGRRRRQRGPRWLPAPPSRSASSTLGRAMDSGVSRPGWRRGRHAFARRRRDVAVILRIGAALAHAAPREYWGKRSTRATTLQGPQPLADPRRPHDTHPRHLRPEPPRGSLRPRRSRAGRHGPRAGERAARPRPRGERDTRVCRGHLEQRLPGRGRSGLERVGLRRARARIRARPRPRLGPRARERPRPTELGERGQSLCRLRRAAGRTVRRHRRAAPRGARGAPPCCVDWRLIVAVAGEARSRRLDGRDEDAGSRSPRFVHAELLDALTARDLPRFGAAGEGALAMRLGARGLGVVYFAASPSTRCRRCATCGRGACRRSRRSTRGPAREGPVRRRGRGRRRRRAALGQWRHACRRGAPWRGGSPDRSPRRRPPAPRAQSRRAREDAPHRELRRSARRAGARMRRRPTCRGTSGLWQGARPSRGGGGVPAGRRGPRRRRLGALARRPQARAGRQRGGCRRRPRIRRRGPG